MTDQTKGHQNSWLSMNNVSPEQLIRKRWTNSMACSFAWSKYLRVFVSSRHLVCFLCYRSRPRPALATVNTKWIWDDSYDTWNFPVRQAVAVQTCNIPCWSSSWTDSLHTFFNLQQTVTRKTRYRCPVYVKRIFLIFWCRLTFRRFCRPFLLRPA